MTPAIAKRLEDAEAHSYSIFWEGLSPEPEAGFIPHKTRIGSTSCHRVTTGALAMVNRAHGFGFGEEPTAEHLAAIREVFAPSARWLLSLNPYAEHLSKAMTALGEAGFRPFAVGNISAALPAAVPEPQALPGVEVVLAGPEHLDGVHHCNEVGYGMPPEDANVFRVGVTNVIRQPGALVYLALVEGRPAAVGELHLHPNGVGFLAGAATLPDYRGRGLQTLLIRLRAAEARRRGCELLGVETGIGTQSQFNQQSNGFHLAYTKTEWRVH